MVLGKAANAEAAIDIRALGWFDANRPGAAGGPAGEIIGAVATETFDINQTPCVRVARCLHRRLQRLVPDTEAAHRRIGDVQSTNEGVNFGHEA